MLGWTGKSLSSAHYASNISITSMDFTAQFIASYPADISPFLYFILFFYLWLIFAERFARSVHSPSHYTLRPRTCALLGWCYYRTKFGSAWSLKWKTFSIWTLPISSPATWWEVNTGVNTWCASCYLLMPQWALKSSLLTVDLLHYINRYWRRFFFSFFLISRKDSYFPRNICGRCLCLHSQ